MIYKYENRAMHIACAIFYVDNIMCALVCYVASKILVAMEKNRRRKNPNWLEEDKEKYGDGL